MKPKLRFKGFNDEWKSDSICNLTTYVDYRGKTPSKTDSGIFLVTAKNVKKGFIDYNNSKEYVDENKYEEIMHRGKPIIGDVLITTEAPCGNVAQVDNENVALAQRIIKYRGNNNIDNTFLKYELLSDFFQNELKKVTSGGTVSGVKGSILHKMEIHYCTKMEQVKISNFLSLLDKKIELQSKKIEDLKLLKLSLKEKLFYMFPTDNKKLSEILIKWNKKNKDNEYSYVESVSNKFGFIAQYEQFEDRNVASNDTSNYYVIEKGVFAYNPSRLNVGSLALKQNDKVSLVSPLYECFTTNQNQDFMLEWFQSKEFRRGTFSKYEGGVRNTLNFNNLSSIEIKLPSLESQNKIVKVLSCYNKMIYLELEKLNKLLDFKKGLMQQLFI